MEEWDSYIKMLDEIRIPFARCLFAFACRSVSERKGALSFSLGQKVPNLSGWDENLDNNTAFIRVRSVHKC